MNFSTQLLDIRSKLESVQQQNKTMKLEKIEYEKEIAYLKQQNQQLIEEKNKFSEMMQLGQIKLSHSKSLSEELQLINSHNADLTKQISQYQALTNRLNKTNKALQSDVQRYQTTIQQLTAQHQTKHKIYVNGTLMLENRVKKLEKECDTLRESVNMNDNSLKPLSLFQSPSTQSNKSYETSYRFRLNSLHSIFSGNGDSKALYNQLRLTNSAQTDDAMSLCIINDEDIISQLQQFGYTENDIHSAMNSVEGSVDINRTVEILEDTEDRSVVNYKMEQTNETEMVKLQRINKGYAQKINRLQSRIKYLKQKELKINENEEVGCRWTDWFSFALK